MVENSKGIVIFNEDMIKQDDVYDYKYLQNFNLELGLLMAREIALSSNIQ